MGERKKKKRLFGTDGIRGKANHHPMTGEVAFEVGRAAAYVLKRQNSRNKILIGKDTRLSGYMLESALTSGICSAGCNVILVGPLPTPGIAFATRSLRVDAGIVISASHNPYDDNGIKFFSSDGFKLPDEIEEEIERVMYSKRLEKLRPEGSRIGRAKRVDDVAGRYIEYIKATFPKGMTLEGMRVVVDCGNGAAYRITPTVLAELGADVIAICDSPNGININDNCGATHPDTMRKAVLQYRADVGIAHDGDADRTILCDERGEIVDGDRIMAICARDMKKDGTLRNNAVIATVMSNIGLEIYLKKQGIKLIRTKVGDRYVVEEMLRQGCNLGGEQSGHIVFLDCNTTGDGPITALQVLSLMARTQKRLSELTADVPIFPQVLVNVPVRDPHTMGEYPTISSAIKRAEKKVGDGRVLVRPSGTEPKVRIMVEGDNVDEITLIAEELAEVIKKNMA